MNKNPIYSAILICLLVFGLVLVGCGDKESGDQTNLGGNGNGGGNENPTELIGKWGKYGAFMFEMKTDGSGFISTRPINWSVSGTTLTFDDGFGLIESVEWLISNSKLYLSNPSGIILVGFVNASPFDKLD
jgi:hypothetical protein